MSTKSLKRNATMSDMRANPDASDNLNFPFRVFYEQEASGGFDANGMVFMGYHDFASEEEAQNAIDDYTK